MLGTVDLEIRNILITRLNKRFNYNHVQLSEMFHLGKRYIKEIIKGSMNHSRHLVESFQERVLRGIFQADINSIIMREVK